MGRAMRRLQKLEMRLGGTSNLEPSAQKPRGMHWRTYQRLRAQADIADAKAADLLMGLAGGVVDPRPPRRQRGRPNGRD
jgi:hypothetical protein